jgi:LmbE family N-acetylglucosaminyl deacetylase
MARVLASDPAAPLVLLSPHLDDAVWACFCLLGPNTVVATAFAGIPQGEPGWWDVRCGITDSAAHVRARRAEDAAVLQSLGARPVHLPLLDGQYRTDDPRPGDLIDALSERVPAAARVVAWAGIGHPDHRIVRDAGMELHRRGMAVTIAADYCYSTRHGWPTWVNPAAGRAEADRQWRELLGDVLGDRLSAPRVVRLTDEQSARKLAAMRGYVTQFDDIENEEPRWQDDGLPPSDPTKRGIEVFYDLDGLELPE